MRQTRRTTIAAVLAVAVLFGSSIPAANAVEGPAIEQPVGDHEITNASVEIHNSAAILGLGLGLGNDVAYPGASMTAHVETTGAESVEYLWTSNPYPDWDGWQDEGKAIILNAEDATFRRIKYLYARATWADGQVRTIATPVSTSVVTDKVARIGGPASVRPGTTLDGVIEYTSAAKLAGVTGRPTWYLLRSARDINDRSKPLMRGAQPLAIQPSWRGKYLQLVVGGSSNYGWDIQESVKTFSVDDVAPQQPVVSLPASTAGRQIDAKVGGFPEGAIPEISWLRNGKVVQGFTEDIGLTYVPDNDQPGDTVQAKVRAVFTDGTVASASASNKLVLSTPKFRAPATNITGTARVGSKLAAVRGIGELPAKVVVSKQWLRDGKAIRGATGATYKLAVADAGKKISVSTSYKPFDRAAVSSTSRPTGKVAPAKMTVGRVSIVGTPRVGTTITAKASRWQAGASLKYQWLRSGRTVKGATKPALKLTALDAGRNISVRVTASKHGYTTVSATSGNYSVAKR